MSYNKIFNPKTKEYIDVHTETGYKLIKKYNQLKGGKPKPVIDPEALLDVASDEDNVDEIYRLLDLGIDINLQSEYGETALHYAISNNCIENAMTLIDESANLNIVNNDGFTPFTLLCESFLKEKFNNKEQDGIDLFKYMLKNDDLDVNTTISDSSDNDSGLILLVKFAKINTSISYQLVNLLLTYRKDNLDINYQNKAGDNALDISIKNTDDDNPNKLSKLLYENGAISSKFDSSTLDDDSQENESENQDSEHEVIPTCGTIYTGDLCYDGAERLFGGKEISIREQLLNHGISSSNINQVHKVEYLVNLLSKYMTNMNNQTLKQPKIGPNLVAFDNDNNVISEPIMFQNPNHRPFFGSASILNTYIPFSLINQLVPMDMKDELNDDETGWTGNKTKFSDADSANWYKLQDLLKINDVVLDTNCGDIVNDGRIAFLVIENTIDEQLSLLGFRVDENTGTTLDSNGMGIHPISKEKIKLI